ncbi:hypothetical protein SAMN04489735_101652 [Aneurinibacillus thermoaerophilus]|uniref:Uncharacterized protein n=1 Tax=Aneurinibacillus thermoaerophilus TaxID=143495 RepID=A0A1G8AKK6_ANETH|nr:hypothetical protein SAMN04489735_101652 [Aneurinibacillus thermoaerophilus]
MSVLFLYESSMYVIYRMQVMSLEGSSRGVFKTRVCPWGSELKIKNSRI